MNNNLNNLTKCIISVFEDYYIVIRESTYVLDTIQLIVFILRCNTNLQIFEGLLEDFHCIGTTIRYF